MFGSERAHIEENDPFTHFTVLEENLDAIRGRTVIRIGWRSGWLPAPQPDLARVAGEPVAQSGVCWQRWKSRPDAAILRVSQVAQFNGTGSTDGAASFVCKRP